MENRTVSFTYEYFSSVEELSDRDQNLLKESAEASKKAYAPYSKFRVGAALAFEDNTIYAASNQENAAFPSGLCAERVALFYAKAQRPDQKVITIAIFASDVKTKGKAISPCGSCRQVISEYEQQQRSTIRILLMNANNEVWQFHSIEDLLPFSFRQDFVKKQN